MCRFLAYVGRPVGLEDLVWEHPHSIVHQSWAPRHQRPGAVNADGFGVGWYDLAVRPEPARWRSPRPAWAERGVRSVAGLVRTTCVLAAVRDATPPTPVEESGTPPFIAGPWLFAHNGAVEGFASSAAGGFAAPGGAPSDRRVSRSAADARPAGPPPAVLPSSSPVSVRLRHMVSDTRAAAIEGASDSEVLFALTLDRLDAGADPTTALARVVAEVGAVAPARLNLVLTDGRKVAATASGDSLFVLESDGAVVVASEPYDDDPRWQPVPDGSSVGANASGATVAPLTPAGRSRS